MDTEKTIFDSLYSCIIDFFQCLTSFETEEYMLAITVVYVIATIFISRSNSSSAKAINAQTELIVSQLREQRRQNLLLSEQLHEQKNQFAKQLDTQIAESNRARQDWNTDKTTQRIQFTSAQKQQREIFEAQILEQRRIDSERYRPQVDVTLELDSDDNLGIKFCNTGTKYAKTVSIQFNWEGGESKNQFMDFSSVMCSDKAFQRSFLSFPEEINLGISQSMFFTFGNIEGIKDGICYASAIPTIISCGVDYEDLNGNKYNNSFSFDLKNYLGQTKLK